MFTVSLVDHVDVGEFSLHSGRQDVKTSDVMVHCGIDTIGTSGPASVKRNRERTGQISSYSYSLKE